MKRIFTLFLFFTTITIYGQVTNKLSPADKIYGLSKLWQEVSYNFVYLEKFGREKWDSAYRAAIPLVLDTKNDYQYYRELQKLCALLKDGHTNVYMPFEEFNSHFGDYRIYLININNKAIIIAVNYSKKDEIPVGSEVTEVNGKPTPEYIKENVAPYISASTPYVLQDLSVERLLRGIEGDRYEIKIRTPEGKNISLSLVHSKTLEKEMYSTLGDPTWGEGRFNFRWYDNQIAYLALNSFGNPKIDTLFIEKLPELYKAKGLIIDLRNNGGGSSYVGGEIFKYLTNDKLIYGPRASSRNHIPVYKAWGGLFQPKDTITGNAARGLSKEEVLKYYLASKDRLYFNLEYSPDTNKVKKEKLIVPTVILIGHNTASAAEDFLILSKDQKHMVTIGESSFGSTGQPYEFRLPGGGSARVCTLKVTYPDGTEFVGCGVKPDIEVRMTLDDYLQKRDPVVEKALEYLKTRFINNQ